jgi:hypothetical protein
MLFSFRNQFLLREVKVKVLLQVSSSFVSLSISSVTTDSSSQQNQNSASEISYGPDIPPLVSIRSYSLIKSKSHVDTSLFKTDKSKFGQQEVDKRSNQYLKLNDSCS